MAMYESEHTKFMREWMAKHPEELIEQQKGRALWWDKPQSLVTAKENGESSVAPTPYAFQAKV